MRTTSFLAFALTTLLACDVTTTSPLPGDSDGGGSGGNDSGGTQPGVDGAIPNPANDASSPGVDAATPGVDAAAMASLEQHCVDKINEYRATLSLPPYQRNTSQEACVDSEAKSDGMSGTPHGAFGTCNEFAQNECPGYPASDIQGSLDQCLAQMWGEGPGTDFSTHGHYINMTSTTYTKAACGFFTLTDGSFWGAQDFE